MEEMLADVDWHSLFSLSLPAAEIIVRGSAMYWFLFLIFRFIVRRDVGAVGLADILLLVIVADAAQNAMAGEYTSISDGMVLVATLIAWNVAMDVLSYRFPLLRRFVQPRPLCIVRNGRLLRQNMRREFITEDDLRSKLRESGVDRLEDVKAAFIESDGAVSVVKKKSAGGG